MKAIICKEYSLPESLTLEETPKPSPKEDEVLIKIRATAVNDYDWSMVTGKPKLYRLLFGLRKPKHPIPGMELSGIVEEIGASVSNFKAGDSVYGDVSEFGFGTFAEYMCINEKALIHKPNNMSFEDACAISHASMLAYQGLHDIGQLKKNNKVLINGAGGGVGTIGLQLAKLYDCTVTGVDTGEKLSMMKSIGFDHVIDYKKIDFTKTEEKYDLILDVKTTRSPRSYTRCLNPSGKYITVGGTISRLIQHVFSRLIFRKSVFVVALKPNKDLDHMNQLYDEGKVKPIIDGPYSLEELPKAIQRFGEGKHSGKVVISIP